MLQHRFLQLAAIHELMDTQHEKSEAAGKKFKIKSHGHVSIAGNTDEILPRIKKLWEAHPDSTMAIEDPDALTYHLGIPADDGDVEAHAEFHKTFPNDASLGENILNESLANDHATFVEEYTPDGKVRLHRVVNQKKSAFAARAIPTTGPEALAYHLSRINLDDVEAQHHALIKSGKVSKRDQAVKTLNIVEGMRRNDLHPRELMIKHVPVIPAVFRPFSLAGSTFIPGDANELYRDLFTNRKVYDEAKRELGPEGEGEATGNLYSAVRALYGFGEPVNDKARARGVSGFFEKIVGSSPKFGYAQRRLLSKPVDNVGRATITINPDLGLDEVGIPRDMAWDIFDTKLHRHLVRKGFSPADAALSLKNRDDHAKRALEEVVPNHPVQYSRAPAWHQFSTLGGMPKLCDGNTIQINPYVTAGLNADFDVIGSN